MTEHPGTPGHGQGQVHAAVPGARHGPGRATRTPSRRSSSRPSARRCSSGRGCTSVAVERLPRPGTLLHPRAARAAGLDRRHPRPRRHRARVPQRLRAPRQQGRVAGAPAARRPAAPAGSSPASTTAGATASTAGHARHQRAGVLRPRQELAAACRRCTARCSPGSSSSTSPRTRCRCATFLGERILELEAYPFDLMTQRYGFSTRIHGNWKLAVDSVCEWYHPPYVHGRFIDPDVAKAEKMVPPVDAYHYDLFPPHMLTSVPGPPPLPPREPGTAGPAGARPAVGLPAVPRRPVRPRRRPRHRPAARVPEQGSHPVVGQRPVLAVPEPLDPDLGPRTTTSPTRTGPRRVDSHIYEIDLYFVPPANAARAPRPGARRRQHDRVRHAGRRTRSRRRTRRSTTRAQQQFQLSDQELLIRNFHKVVRDTVAAHQPAAEEEALMTDHRRRCPKASPSSSRTSPTGPARPAQERYDDAPVEDHRRARRVLRRHRAARRGGDRLPRTLDLDALPEDATRLLQLLYSMILVSYAVNIFKPAPHPRLRRGVLRHRRRAGGLTQESVTVTSTPLSADDRRRDRRPAGPASSSIGASPTSAWPPSTSAASSSTARRTSTTSELVAFSRLLGEVVIAADGRPTGPPGDLRGHPRPVEEQARGLPGGHVLLAHRRDHRRGAEQGHAADRRRCPTTAAATPSSPTPTPPTRRCPTPRRRELEGVRVVHSFAAAQLLVYPNPSPKERAAWDRVPAREQPAGVDPPRAAASRC